MYRVTFDFTLEPMAEERLEEIRAARLQRREDLIAQGNIPYPAEVRRSHTLVEIGEQFKHLQLERTPITVVGRVASVRRHGGVAFIDVSDATGKLQLQLSKETTASDAFERLTAMDAGDFIEAAGKLMLTKRGVQTLAVDTWHTLAKSIRPLPGVWFGLKDHEARFRQREIDFLLNPSARDTLVMRSRIITWLRHYFVTDGYLEIDTPILQALAGGAAAKPFTTHHNALDSTLYLRISAELYLKRLLVSGFEKVFEIGHYFRNEGIDRQHNPEFTMLESQWAYADYEDLMDFTDSILEKLVISLKDTAEVTWQEQVLTFANPLPRKRYVELVGEALQIDILHNQNPATYLEIFHERGIEVPKVATYAKLIDDLYKTLVRPTLIQPTILYDYPVELAPLAKRSAHDPRIAEKFQVVAAGMEIVNAYTELNDPVEQRQRFAEQAAARKQGDDEALFLDEEYLRAQEYGMPPNAGWGLGVDRLVALLTNAPTLRDTIAFPLLKPEK